MNEKLLIYLDQNVLSNLRSRKLLDKNNPTKYVELFLELFDGLKHKYAIIYSTTILEEISNINSPEYIMEHLDTLAILKAYLLGDKTLSELQHPHAIYEKFLENQLVIKPINKEYENLLMKINQVKSCMYKDNQFFTDIVKKDIKFLTNFLISDLNGFSRSSLNQAINYRLIECKIENFIEPLQNMPDDFNLTELRTINWERYLGKPLKKIEERNAVSKILLALSIHFNDYHFLLLFADKSIPFKSKVEFMYMFLNWVGYYPDKFQNIKKKSGYFHSSMRDSRHFNFGIGAECVISEDENFAKKANACCFYLGLKEKKVLTPVEFLEKYRNYDK